MIGAQPLESNSLAYVQTAVLKRCTKCGEHFTVTYAGNWTLEDFAKKRNDIDTIRAMAGE